MTRLEKIKIILKGHEFKRNIDLNKCSLKHLVTNLSLQIKSLFSTSKNNNDDDVVLTETEVGYVTLCLIKKYDSSLMLKIISEELYYL